MSETFASIAAWSRAQWPSVGWLEIWQRAEKEMGELYYAIIRTPLLLQNCVCLNQPDYTSLKSREDIVEEIADVLIVLSRLAVEVAPHVALWDVVESKMVTNRARRWNGQQHVE